LWTGQVVSPFFGCRGDFYGLCFFNHSSHEDSSMRHGVYLASGPIFGLGLAISQMVDPLKV
jgi:hypothetical protein